MDDWLLRRTASLTLCHVPDDFDDDREYRRPHHESLLVRLQKELLALAESVGRCASSACANNGFTYNL